jgi:prepilin-type N-terminal cleavage/methylation domain-containing protein
MRSRTPAGGTTKARRNRGFSLVELLVASAVFLLIAKVAFDLFAKQQVSSEVVQGQVGLNLALRNAATQLQVDLANAGSYSYQGTNVPSWPVGVTIVNNWVNSGSSCYTSATNTYGASCFDKINIIAAADPSVAPAISATSSAGGNNPSTDCSNTSLGMGYGMAASGSTLPATAGKFLSGDQLLFVKSDGTQMTSVVLTANAAVAGSAIKFTFQPTLSQSSGGYTYLGYNTRANDPLDITTCMGVTPCPAAQQPSGGQVSIGNLGQSFCYGDWIVKLAPITYQVDTTTNSANPTLTRTQNGVTSNVMEQVIGFKIGAAIWNAPFSTDGTDLTPCDPNNPGATGICPFVYNAAYYNINGTGGAHDQAYNFTMVRAVRLSLIGRSTPNNDPNYKIRNAFDGGPYQVQSTAVTVNPRDLSMNDN